MILDGERNVRSPQPSTSGAIPKKKTQTRKKKVVPKKEMMSGDSSGEDTNHKANKKGRKKTSTPKKRTRNECAGAPGRMKLKQKSLRLKELVAVKARLDEGRLVDLSPDSSFDATRIGEDVNEGHMQRDECSEEMAKNIPNPERGGGGGNKVPVEGNESQEAESLEDISGCEREGGGGNQVPVMGNGNLEFESLDSTVLSELREILNDLSSGNDNSLWEESDPDMTRLLVGLIGNDEEKFSNAFEVAESIRRKLVHQAEQAGSRALNWNLSHFDRIGGRGTITSVWNILKSDERVGGKKRILSRESNDEDPERKKFKLSLNLSGTCDRISEIELSDESLISAEASQLYENREASRFVSFNSSYDSSESASFSGNRTRRQLPDTPLASAQLNDNSVLAGDDEDGELEATGSSLQVVEDNGNILNVHDLNLSLGEIQEDGIEFNVLGDEFSSIYSQSQASSIPDLATQSDMSSYYEESGAESDKDSGVSDRMVGNVTNLCRRRRRLSVNDGVVTETGPYIPVSLGFSDIGSSGSWEDVMDENGCHTGLERRTFRLNVLDGRTDSVDDELASELRSYGMRDGINTRWEAGEYGVSECEVHEVSDQNVNVWCYNENEVSDQNMNDWCYDERE